MVGRGLTGRGGVCDGRLPVVAVRDPVVCVVGAGPAGLALAHVLHRTGVSCVVVERQERSALGERAKAGMIEHRTVELLRKHKLADAILERGSRSGVCEFRADREALVLDYAALCGGRGHHIYPQQELVADWVERLLAAGSELRFGVRATGVEQDEEGARVSVEVLASGVVESIECELVVCCDGASAALTNDLIEASRTYPFRWLTLLAAVPPSTTGAVYGLHPDGFAAELQRSATVTRFMLEVPQAEGFDEWPDGRIWEQLERRLAAKDRPPVEPGEFIARDILDHRVRVFEPMQSHRIFYAGDAAHLITPAGGKGMNLAIQDAIELAAGISERFTAEGNQTRVEHYSHTRLPLVWRQQEFSNFMLSLFNAHGNHLAPEQRRFAYGLRRARLERVINDPSHSRWFAHAYAGVDQ